ncbi:MAG: hypothetical protein ACRELC_04915, partial [Gemmatimonadota bacterium]
MIEPFAAPASIAYSAAGDPARAFGHGQAGRGVHPGDRLSGRVIRTEHVTIERRARYAALGDRKVAPAHVWFVLHGYGQLAPRFVRSFEALDDGSRWIVAPEGLHRYYLDHAERKVGASWMT